MSDLEPSPYPVGLFAFVLVQLLIFLLQLPYPLLHGGVLFANARLTVLFSTVLRQPPPDHRLADARLQRYGLF